MSDWSHGYDVSTEYSYGFFREMAPDWLDFCAWIGGFQPPRKGGEPFRYLDLGCGQGFGLCLLAGANPGAEFVGVDFQPEHIAHANGLASAAGLSNVRFVQADFLDLADQWPADLGSFEYVALHGILSWVSPLLRNAVVHCLNHATAAGALVYASYNSQPGCLSSVPLQHFSRSMKEVSGSPGGTAVEQSIALLESLAAAKAPVFDALPTLKHRLAALGGRDRNYLAHEYLTESWTPLWHSDLAREFHRADLDYVASATLGDNLTTEFLPPPLYQIVSQQPEALRQDVQDFVINQAFRRDIFCRGARRSTPTSPSKDKVRVHLAANLPAGRSLSFETSFGKIEWPPQVFQYLTDALSQGPMTLEDLFRLPSATAWKPRHILLLLLHANVINLEAAHPADVETSSRLNRVIARAVSTGAPYDHLAAARTGSAIRASNEDMLRFAAWLEDERAAETGSFVADTLPLWRRLGVVE